MKPLFRLSKICIIGMVKTLVGCSRFTAVDQPIQHWSRDQGQHRISQAMAGRSSDLLVMVAFSGGGTRAAAFAYGALKELAETEVTTEAGRTLLLHEIDLLSSVSGGSFTSAYYGLHGDRIFDDFEERFLRKNVQGVLLGRWLNPFYWVKRMSPAYSKTDLVAEYYDTHIFDHATFGDFTRSKAPMIIINSTDLAAGSRFPFTQPMFDLICADLDSYPVSRAVAASSAVPVLFSPITLKNYAGQCGFEPPAWLAEAARDEGLTSRKMEGRTLEAYLDRQKTPWFHLVDGGISDNLGLRSFYDIVSLVGDPKSAFSALMHPVPRRILIISVNAHAKGRTEWALKRYSPSLTELLGSVSSNQISRYSTDTIDIVRYAYTQWASQLSTPERPVTFHFVDVSFDAVRDNEEREFLNTIGTNFNLSDKEVDHLISAARRSLRESPAMKAFLGRDASE